MRFLHVVVLPSVFVFASNVGLLQALEFDSDEKDVLADAYGRSNDAAVVSEEERNMQTFFQSLFRRSAAAPKATPTMSAAQAATVVKSTKSVWKGAQSGKKQLSRSFKAILKQWKASGKSFETFVGSPDYLLICGEMFEANRFLSRKDAIHHLEFFARKLPRKELVQAIDGARSSNDVATKEIGQGLWEAAQAKLAKKWGVAAKDVPPDFYVWEYMKILRWKLKQ